MERGYKIQPLPGCEDQVFSFENDGRKTFFCYVQEDSFQDNETVVRDGSWLGAMKAIIVNASENQPHIIDHLVYLRHSKSGKSLIVKAVFKTTGLVEKDLYTLRSDDGKQVGDIDYSNYYDSEQNVIIPFLKSCGFSGDFRFFDGESDSFGPLSRCVVCRRDDGIDYKISYG